MQSSFFICYAHINASFRLDSIIHIRLFIESKSCSQKVWVTPMGSNYILEFLKMPILSQKDNPPSCFLNSSILMSEGTWWVAKLRPQQEKVFAYDLLERQIEYYLPLYTKVTKRSDGKNRKSLIVLFPSYVPFISENPYPLLTTKRVVTILPVTAQSRFKKQLNQIYMINESNVQMSPVTSNEFTIGEVVNVVSGPLKGITGRVAKIQNMYSILITVDNLGCVCVNVNPSTISSVLNPSISD